jgi:signal transduction histidine kinase
MVGDTEALRRMMDITSDTRFSFEEKLDTLLELGCGYLGVEIGFLTRIDDGTQVIVASVGDHAELQTGERCPLEQSYCRKTIEQEGSLTVQHARTEGWGGDPAYETFGLEAYLGARVEVEGELYGTFCFADQTPRDEPFGESEVVFVELLAEWVSHELARQSVTADLQRERDRLEEFANVVSHDLRNPLSVAAGQLTLEQSHRDDESEHLGRATAALERMDTLLGDLLALAKAGDELGQREPVELADLVVRSWQTVDTGNADLQVETEATVDADPVRLAQLFENLFHNAVEHGGSTVTVTVRDVPGGFLVDDDGPGIDPEERPVVTETGYTTSDGGSGFGLHIVEQITHAHGWTLEVTESPSGGARFRFTGVDTVDESPEPVGASDA